MCACSIEFHTVRVCFYIVLKKWKNAPKKNCCIPNGIKLEQNSQRKYFPHDKYFSVVRSVKNTFF